MSNRGLGREESLAAVSRAMAYTGLCEAEGLALPTRPGDLQKSGKRHREPSDRP